MNLLLRHRDAGSRALLAGLRSRLEGFAIVEAEPGQPLSDLTGIDAIFAVGRISGEDIRSGTFGFIQTMGTGYDHVDVAEATHSQVWVANLPAGETGNADGVAELAILLALSLFRKLDEARANVAQRMLARPVGRSLLGKTALIVGLGDVGLAIASRLRPFGMKLLATRGDPARGGPEYVEVHGADELEALAAQVDLIMVSARPNTAGSAIVDAAVLQNVKPGAILINVGRGSLVDHAALEASLRSGRLAGAGLDVFPNEPVDPASSLLQLPNVIATPHIAGVTDVNVSRSLELAAQNFQRFARGEMPRFVVNAAAVPSPRGGYYLPSLDS